MSNMTFQMITEQVKMRDVITMYSHRVVKAVGRTRCPFHNGTDDNFSYNTDVFQCWVCGTKGNVITFVAQMFGISNYEAAKKIDADFNLNIIGNKPSLLAKRKFNKALKERESQEALQAMLQSKYNILTDIHRINFKIFAKAKSESVKQFAWQQCERLEIEMDELQESIDGISKQIGRTKTR